MKLLFILLSVGSFLLHHGAYSVDSVELSVTEGDSVTLHICVEKKEEEMLKWYFNESRIAQINGDLSKICTDVQCKDGDERFRDRLKLDHQTGSLTITNTTNTHSGEYQLQIFGSRNIEKTFSLEVDGVAAAERDEVKTVKQGESVTLPVVIKKTNDVVMWYFNDIRIAESSGDQSQICTDDQCKERFRDRLELDHQTGSLTITHTTNTDSGEYQLQIISNRYSFSISRIRRFIVTVTGSGRTLVVRVGIILLVVAAAAAAVAAMVCHQATRSAGISVAENHNEVNEQHLLGVVCQNEDPSKGTCNNQTAIGTSQQH